MARQAGFREGPPESGSDRCETSGFDLVVWKEDYAQVGENFRTGEAGRRKTEYQDLTQRSTLSHASLEQNKGQSIAKQRAWGGVCCGRGGRLLFC